MTLRLKKLVTPVALLLWLALLESGVVLLAQAPVFSLEGIVLDSETRQPVSGAVLSIAPQPAAGARGAAAASASPFSVPVARGSIASTATTNQEGAFASPGLAAGNYVLTVRKDGYAAAGVEGRKLPSNSGIPVTVGPAQAKYRILLLREGILAGRVLDSAGRPVAAARATALRYAYAPDGARRLYSSLNSSTTNDRGEFRFFGLVPGEYFVKIDGEREQPEFYPGTTEESKASRIVVRAGEEERLGDIVLNSPRVNMRNTLTINMTGVEANGWESLKLEAFEGESAIVTVDFAIGLGLGNPFTLPAEVSLKEKNYPVVASVVFPDGSSFVGRGEVAPKDAGMLASVAMVKASRLTGQVLVENADGSTRPLEGIWVNTQGRQSSRSADNGSFAVPALTDTPSAVTLQDGLGRLPETAYIASAKSGDRDVLAEGIRAAGDTQLEIRVRTDGGTLVGTVTGATGEAILDGVVALLPDGPRRVPYHPHYAARTNLEGRFSMTGVAPGPYRIFAWRELYGAAYLNAEFMKDYAGKGTAVQIDSNGRIDVSLPVLE
jgi:hypothetical protein